MTFVKGHNINKGRLKSEYHKKKLKEARIKGIKEGRIVPWNKGKKGLQVGWSKGLTIESDPRIKKISITESLTKKEKFKNIEYKKKCLQKNTGKFISPLDKINKGRIPSNFNNFSSYEPYGPEFNNQFKRAIILRDNNCLICGSNKSLSIHHIDYNKLRSIKENCICLCNSCHTKTSFNREHWKKFCQSLLNQKYGYKYSDKGDILPEVFYGQI